MLAFLLGVACLTYHIVHVRYLALDCLQTLSQLRELFYGITRSQKLLRRKHLHQHHVLELEQRKQHALHMFFDQARGILLLAAATRDIALTFATLGLGVEICTVDYAHDAITMHLSSFFRVMIWAALVEMALLVRLTIGMVSSILAMWGVVATYQARSM